MLVDKKADIFNSGRELLSSKGFKDTIKKWRAEGKIRVDLDDEMINAIFNSILYTDIHKSKIGLQHFPQILHYTTRFIMKGLTDCRK